MRSSMLLGVCGLALSGLLAAESSAGVVVNFDLDINPNPGTYIGTGVVPGDAGTVWNGLPLSGDGSDFLTATTDSTGATISGPTLTVAYDGQYQEWGWGTTNRLAGDFAISSGTNVKSFSLSGLTANGAYDLYLYGINSPYSDRGTLFTIGSDSKGTNNNISAPLFTEGKDYVLFSGVLADGSGNIGGTYAYNPASQVGYARFEGVFNGLQLVTVPEPTSLALLGLAGSLMLRRRSRA